MAVVRSGMSDSQVPTSYESIVEAGGPGRPRRYADPEEFARLTEQYLAETAKPSLSGLAYELGFEDRESYVQYEEYGPEFSRTVKRARLRIEIDRHERLIDKEKFTAGVIFDLKNNHGWKDQSHQEVTGANGAPLMPQKIVLTGGPDAV